MKRVLFSMVLLMAVSFSFAQMKNVKEAKSMANDVKPNFKQAEQLWILTGKYCLILLHTMYWKIKK